MAPDLDESTLAKLAREIVMNIRNYKETFETFGITEEDYYEIEKNEFFKKVKEQFAIEWNATTSTSERLKVGAMAYFEQLLPRLTRRAIAGEDTLAASTEVGKLLMKTAGMGEQTKGEPNLAERFVITINMGGDTEKFDKPLDITTIDAPVLTPAPAAIAAPEKRKRGRPRKTYDQVANIGGQNG